MASSNTAKENAKKIPPMREQFGYSVLVKVGKKLRSFPVHKDLICQSSPFFRAAFRGDGFKEGHTGVLEQPDVHEETFTLFLQWLYSRVLVNEGEFDRETGKFVAGTDLFELYFYADRIQVVPLKNAIIDALWRFKDARRTISSVKEIYENTTQDDPLRQFVVDAHVWDFPRLHLESSIRTNRLVDEFTSAVVCGLSDVIAGLKRGASKRPHPKDGIYYTKEPGDVHE